MALEQEIDGSGEAESGKEEEQNQVHRSAAYGLEPGEKRRPVRGREKRSERIRPREIHPDCK
jgi:hypothetical protein